MRLSPLSKALALSVCVFGLPFLAYSQSPLLQDVPKSDIKALVPQVDTPKFEPPISDAKKSEMLKIETPTAQSIPSAQAPQAQPSAVSYQATVPHLPVQTNETEGPLTVLLDRAEVVMLPKNIGSLVVGNPLIADASIHPSGFMVITPKGLGTTNIIMLDTKGQTLAHRLVKVKTVSEQTVRVFRGIERETYSCAPNCDKIPAIGDNNAYFDSTIGQANNRSNMLSGASKQN